VLDWSLVNPHLYILSDPCQLLDWSLVNPHLYILSDPCQLSDWSLVNPHLYILSEPCQLSDWSLVNPHLYILSDPCQLSDSTLVIYTVRSKSIVRPMFIARILFNWVHYYCKIYAMFQTNKLKINIVAFKNE
jgi:hypothetical protein